MCVFLFISQYMIKHYMHNVGTLQIQIASCILVVLDWYHKCLQAFFRHWAYFKWTNSHWVVWYCSIHHAEHGSKKAKAKAVWGDRKKSIHIHVKVKKQLHVLLPTSVIIIKKAPETNQPPRLRECHPTLIRLIVLMVEEEPRKSSINVQDELHG